MVNIRIATTQFIIYLFAFATSIESDQHAQPQADFSPYFRLFNLTIYLYIPRNDNGTFRIQIAFRKTNRKELNIHMKVHVCLSVYFGGFTAH